MATKTRPSVNGKVETELLTLQLSLGELQAIKQTLIQAQGLTGQGKVLAGMAEIKIDELLPKQNG